MFLNIQKRHFIGRVRVIGKPHISCQKETTYLLYRNAHSRSVVLLCFELSVLLWLGGCMARRMASKGPWFRLSSGALNLLGLEVPEGGRVQDM